MKLGARDIDGFVANPGKAAGALIYGSDSGQVRQRAAQLAVAWLGANADPMSRVELTADTIKDDPALLADELGALSLMCPRRVIMLREADDPHLPAIEQALSGRAAENFLILYATESLGRDSKLRAWAERRADIAALPCYKDEGSGLESLIRSTLTGYGLRAQPDVLRYLSAQLSGDRQVILNELEKLSLYMGDEAEEVTMEDAAAAVGENNDKSLDDFAYAVAGGDLASLCRLSDRLLAEGHVGLLLVRHLARYLAKLEQLCLARAEGKSLDAAIDVMRPPVFFKAKPFLKSHAARWNPQALDEALAKLQLLELDSKRYSDQSPARLAHGFMEIAQLPGPAKRAA